MTGRYQASVVTVTGSVGMLPTNTWRMVVTSLLQALACMRNNHERHSAIVRSLLNVVRHVTSFVFAEILAWKVSLLSDGGNVQLSMGRFALKKLAVVLLYERSGRIILLAARTIRGLPSLFRLEISKGAVISDKRFVIDHDAIETLRHNNETQGKYLSI
ncbi:hypothetical protein [Rhizobium rhizogenes]|uniref:hypothetical protein n=1 Tax=Rhizobium rhizogenes TaxID=359 RepID=UPI0015730D8C|nr:hypothetical protein [Rhizobium rhizogenes]NTH23368.1 hypothetical protein [Rhizobium rhizogenes]NTH36390.1 hypothetical protein [Rhizobium rhizogenes]